MKNPGPLTQFFYGPPTYRRAVSDIDSSVALALFVSILSWMSFVALMGALFSNEARYMIHGALWIYGLEFVAKYIPSSWHPHAIFGIDSVDVAAWCGLIVSLIAFVFTFMLFMKITKEEHQAARERQIAGRLVNQNIKAATRYFSNEIAHDYPGVHIHPDIQISRRRETQHFIVVAGSGSGKTNMLQPIINNAIRDGSICIIYDPKSQFVTSVIPDPIILNPCSIHSKSIATR